MVNPATISTGTKDTRERYKFVFWLDLNKPDEYDIAAQLYERSKERQMKPTIQKALELYLALEQGNTDALYSMFPWLQQHSDASAQFDELMAKINEIATSPSRIAAERSPTRPHTMADDPTLELEIKQAKSDENAAYNMMLSGVAIGATSLDELPSAVIEYGIKRGKLNATTAQKILDSRSKVSTDSSAVVAVSGSEQKEKSGPKQMDVPQFDAPTFDDLELEF